MQICVNEWELPGENDHWVCEFIFVQVKWQRSECVSSWVRVLNECNELCMNYCGNVNATLHSHTLKSTGNNYLCKHFGHSHIYTAHSTHITLSPCLSYCVWMSFVSHFKYLIIEREWTVFGFVVVIQIICSFAMSNVFALKTQSLIFIYIGCRLTNIWFNYWLLMNCFISLASWSEHFAFHFNFHFNYLFTLTVC